MQEEDQFEYTDEEEEQDDGAVALENAYYNSKGLRENSSQEAAESFEAVIRQEREELQKSGSTKKYGPWSYKAMKQLTKLYLRAGQYKKMMWHYNRLLECIADGDVSPSAVEKGINGMLDRVSTMYQGNGVGSAGSGGSGGALITDVVFESLQEDDSGKCECSWCWSARSCLECLLIVSQSCNNKNQAVLLTTNKSLLQKEVIV